MVISESTPVASRDSIYLFGKSAIWVLFWSIWLMVFRSKISSLLSEISHLVSHIKEVKVDAPNKIEIITTKPEDVSPIDSAANDSTE